MFNDYLIPVPLARRVRIAHNESAIEGKSARVFIRERKLAGAFSNVADLRRAIEHNNLWTLEITRSDCSQQRIIASTHFTALLQAGGANVLETDAADETIAPPFPRHDGLIVECVRDHDAPPSWTMSWRDGSQGRPYQLKSKCLRSVFVRALEISAGVAEATLEAFERSTVPH